MNKLKHYIAALAVIGLLALAVPSAEAQQYKLTSVNNAGATPINGGTNTVANATTNTYSFTIPLLGQGDVVIQPVFKLTGSGTSAVAFTFDSSADGTNWHTGTLVLSVTAAGTSTVTAQTNWTVNALGYLRLNTVGNPNATTVTNLNVLLATKPDRYRDR